MDKKAILRENWVSNFTLIGKPRINADYTFKIDEKSEKSDWIYNSINLGIDCGEKFGTVYCENIGGYGEDRKNEIYARDKEDPKKSVVVAWEDRFNDEILEGISDNSFITVGLEKTNEEKTFYKRFLSAYDAIAYIKEHLTEDMVVNVRGKLKYSSYNDSIQVKKEITSIALSKVDDPSKYVARFTQTVLLDKDSASLKNVDKDKSVMYVDTVVLDFLKEYNGIKLVNEKGEEKGGWFPYNKQFEFKLNLENEKQCKAVYEQVFKVKSGITQITFEGEFIEGGAVVTATLDDVPDDIKSLIGVVYTEEEVLARCTVNGNKERRMVLKKPVIKLVGEDKKPVMQKFEKQYKEEDLVLDYLYSNSKPKKDEAPFDIDETESDTDDSMSWLNDL